MEVDSKTLTAVLGGVTTALLLYYLTKKKDGNYPTGPMVFPLLGNLPQIALSGSLAKFLQSYRRKFGNIYTFEFGGSKQVVVSGYEEIRELLIKQADVTSTRSTDTMTEFIQNTAKVTPGMIWAPYPHWKTLRSFAINVLREDGMGKAALEPQILEEIDQYVEHFIQPNLGKPIEMTLGISQATANIISQMVYSKRFDYDDESFNNMISAVNETTALMTKISLFSGLPLGRFFIKSALARDHYLNHEIILPTLQSYIDEHKASLDKDHPRDLTDRYLIHSEEGDKGACFSDGNAPIVGVQLYVAGTETTSTSLRWALLFMCLHPDVKAKVQQEIDEQIGPDRAVSCKDRVNMPYTDAVLLETLRKGDVASVGLPRTLEKETVIDGKLIPGGAGLMINLTSVLRDETVFEESDKFKPDRYLTGDIALKKQRTIPFGIGRRACPGESLAKMEFFMFFVTFLQKYDVRLPNDSTVTEDPLPTSLIQSPTPYHIIFTSRHHQ